jgi:hypothetical protein
LLSKDFVSQTQTVVMASSTTLMVVDEIESIRKRVAEIVGVKEQAKLTYDVLAGLIDAARTTDSVSTKEEIKRLNLHLDIDISKVSMIADFVLTLEPIASDLYVRLFDKYLEERSICEGKEKKSLSKDGLLAFEGLFLPSSRKKLILADLIQDADFYNLLDFTKFYFPYDMIDNIIFNDGHLHDSSIDFAIDSCRIMEDPKNLGDLLEWIMYGFQDAEYSRLRRPSCDRVLTKLIRSKLYSHADLLLQTRKIIDARLAAGFEHTYPELKYAIIRIVGAVGIKQLRHPISDPSDEFPEFRESILTLEAELQSITDVLTHPCHAVNLPDCLAQLTIEYL